MPTFFEPTMSPRELQRRLRQLLDRPVWSVEVDGAGVIRLVDRDGNDPLKHPDPLVRLVNMHVAAQAPLMRQLTVTFTRRFELIDGGWKRDEELISYGWLVVYLCQPPESEVRRLTSAEGQGEVYFEEAA